MSAFAPRFNMHAAAFMPSASSSSAAASALAFTGNPLVPAGAENYSYSDLLGVSGFGAGSGSGDADADALALASARAPTQKLKLKSGGKKAKGKRIDPSLLGFQ